MSVGIKCSFIAEDGKPKTYVYQGNTFSNVGSWVQGTGGAGGNMILKWNTDVATTRKQVRKNDRKMGLLITYFHPDDGLVNEQYKNELTLDGQWVIDSNWEKIAYRSDIHILNVNYINDIDYTLDTAVLAALDFMKKNNIPRFHGLIITYRTATIGLKGNWEIAQYCYEGTQDDYNFVNTKDGRWIVIPNLQTITTLTYSAALKYAATLNLNLLEDKAYTLETAVDKAYELVGAVKGIIIKYRISADNVSPTKYETKIFTYGKTMNEANFKNLVNWRDYHASLYDLTDKIDWFNDYEDITDQKTADLPGKLINTDGNVTDTGTGGGLYEYDVKQYQEFRFITRLPREGQVFAAFYDINNTPLTYKHNIGSLEDRIYYAKAPIGAAKMRVRRDSYAYVYRKKNYVNELENNYDPQSINFDAIVPLATYNGELATPIEVLEGKVISNATLPYGCIIKNDNRCDVYKFSNGYYRVGAMGASFSVCAVAYDVNDKPVKVIKGVGQFSNFCITPVPNAAYILVASSAKINKVYNLTFELKKSVPNFEFNPIPDKTSGLKILTIGNSFSQDTWAYVPDILKQAGITDAVIAFTFISGGSLQTYYNLMINDDSTTIRMLKSVNNSPLSVGIPETTYSLEQVLTQEKWDIVILQQNSGNSFSFVSFEPYMSELISYIKSKVKNRKVCIMFNMVWSGEKSYTNVDENQRYNEIVQCTKEMIAQIGLPYIIPNGTAIQIGRNISSIITDRNWTRDGYHIDLGVGRYVLAATTFQSIFGYIYDKDIRDYKSFTTSNGTAVNAENIDMLNNCAFDASIKRFQ